MKGIEIFSGQLNYNKDTLKETNHHCAREVGNRALHLFNHGFGHLYEEPVLGQRPNNTIDPL